MAYSKTKRVSKYAAIAWLCLLAIVRHRASRQPAVGQRPAGGRDAHLHDDPALHLGVDRLGHRRSLDLGTSGRLAPPFTGLNASTGEITVKSGANIDYESSDKSYSITISVTDGEDASGEAESPPTTDATTSVRIEVINIDDPGRLRLRQQSRVQKGLRPDREASP